MYEDLAVAAGITGLLVISFLVGYFCAQRDAAVQWFRDSSEQIRQQRENVERIKREFREQCIAEAGGADDDPDGFGVVVDAGELER